MLLKNFLLFFTFILLYCEVEGAGSKSCWRQERGALVDLQKAATALYSLVPPFIAFNKSATPWFQWDDEVADCCEWQGVQCDPHSGRVIELRLPTCEGLRSKLDLNVLLPVHCFYKCSSLPSTLSQLEALQVLDLRGGCFTGDIPPHTFTTLTNLTHLDLSNNFFYPAQLPLLPKLTYFNFSSNYFYLLIDGHPGFNFSSLARSLPHLRYLDLSNSQVFDHFTWPLGNFNASLDSLPSELNANFLPHLIHLDISGNLLSGVIPEQLGTLQSLQYLNLADNRFRNPLPWPSLANLSQLSFLQLGSVAGDDDAEILVWEERRTQWPCKWKALESLSCENMRFASNDSTPICLEQSGIISKLRHLSFTSQNGSIAPLLHSLSSVNVSLNLQSLLLPGTSLGEFQAPHPPSWLRPLDTPFLESLDVSQNALTSFPAWLSPQLPLLEHLDISNNNLTEFPSTLRHSRFLKSLDISFNNLSVSLHQLELHSSAQLQSLTLRGNAIRGSIPRSLLMPSLSVLDLSDNRLAGGIPFPIGNISLLTDLDLSGNHLTGAIPPSIGMLKLLRYLDLSGNHLTGAIPPSIGMLKALFYLHLSDNMLSGEFPQSMENLTALTMLDVSYNNLLGVIPASIFQSKLSSLFLSSNNLSGSLPAPSLQNCAALQLVDLSNNHLSGSFPHLFKNCPLLSTISLSNNSLSGALPQTYQNCKFLRQLDLSSNNLTGEIPEGMFLNCSDLAILNLGQNSLISFEVPASVAKVWGIEVLVLTKNELSGAIPSALQNCRFLRVLDLSHNHLSGHIPPWISGAHFPALMVLMLSNNKLQGSIPFSLVENFTSLQIMGLANNNLSGSIPTHLNYLVGMTQYGGVSANSSSSVLYTVTLSIPNKGTDQALGKYILSATVALDLSSNYLEGPIPAQIGALKGLTILNLSRNTLTGPIPSTLGGLSATLESLDLSNNQLEGGVPSELCSMDRLGDLDLSSNHLQGPIPACPRLSNFDNSCFEHNARLCGLPLPEQCTEEAPAAPVQEGGHHRTWFEKVQEEVALGGVGVGYAVGLLVTGWVLNRHLLPP